MMATKNPESIADRLKKIVDLNGHSYLEDEPYRVYTDLVESGAADSSPARPRNSPKLSERAS